MRPLLLVLLLLAAPLFGQVPIPAGKHFVASAEGRVYYPVSCDAWHSLKVSNLRWFATEAEAKAAKLTRTTNKACG